MPRILYSITILIICAHTQDPELSSMRDPTFLAGELEISVNVYGNRTFPKHCVGVATVHVAPINDSQVRNTVVSVEISVNGFIE